MTKDRILGLFPAEDRCPSPTAISAYLPEGLSLGREIICLDQVDSTNTYLKKLAAQGAQNGTVVIANGQTEGRGRQERTFYSPKGAGLYLSILLRPPCPPKQAVDLTAWIAVAVCDVLAEHFHIRPSIKWTNDLLLGGRKVCGILTEMSADWGSGTLEYVIAGIGINLTQRREQFAALGLGDVATSLAAEGLGPEIDRCVLAAALISALDTMAQEFPKNRASWLDRYRADCITTGRQILVLRGGQALPAMALWVEDDFSLRVRWEDGREERLCSGEVSVQGLMGQG